MAQPIVLTGSNIKLYINNQVYTSVQSISFSIDYGESEIYGIDSVYPQEIAVTKCAVRGSVNGLRIKLSGGIQSANLRPLYSDIAASPYISIRIQDRNTKEDILYIPNAKVTRESHSVAIRSTYKLNFDFVGMVPFSPLDRVNNKS
jgi:hypothetical protein